MSDSTASKPFVLLRSIAQSYINAGVGMPTEADNRPMWSGVGFVLGGVRMVASMSEVVEMMTVPPATRLPGVKPWVQGVANLRGRLLPLIDMEMFLETGVSVNAVNRRVVSIEQSDVYAGLVMNQVFGMQHFPVDSYNQAVQQEVPQALLPFIEGCYEHMGESWVVFSPKLLCKNELFLSAAS